MEQDNKYYTPEVEELHVGYECEYDNLNKQESEWKPLTIGLCSIGDIENAAIRVRTPYLTREDIESLGWVLMENTRTPIWKMGTEYHLSYTDYQKPTMMTIDNNQDYDDLHTYYEGEIKSKNELVTLMRWLQIK